MCHYQVDHCLFPFHQFVRQAWSVLLAGADIKTGEKVGCVFLNDYHSTNMLLLSHLGKDKYG